MTLTDTDASYTQAEYENGLEQARRTATALETTRWQADVERLNEELNAAATRFSLCSDYEDTLRRVNERCTLIELKGREKDWTANISLTVTFTATSGDEHDVAEEIRSNLYVEGGSVSYSTVDDVDEA